MKFIPTLTKIDFNSTGYFLKQNCIPFQKGEVEKTIATWQIMAIVLN